MQKSTVVVLATAVALIALVAGYFSHLWLLDNPPAQDPGQALLAASLEDVNGRKQALTQWQGKVLVVNFWATWCPPCLKEIPEFVRLQEKFGERGVQFIGIAIDDKAKVQTFMASLGINYPVLLAQTEGIALARQAGNRLGGLPFTVIINRNGKAAKVELGTLDEAKLTPVLNGLL